MSVQAIVGRFVGPFLKCIVKERYPTVESVKQI
jgi:hypothetical protein